MADVEEQSERLKLQEASKSPPEEGAGNTQRSEDLEEKPNPLLTCFWLCLLPLVTVIVSIALIVVGKKHLNDCRQEKFIPVFMIVQGVFTLFYSLWGGIQHILERITGKKEGSLVLRLCSKIFTQLVALFLLAWFIAGNVWVFRVHKTVEFNNRNSTNYCDESTYQFAFWYIIVVYILALIAIPICLIMCFCVGVVGCLTNAFNRS